MKNVFFWTFNALKSFKDFILQKNGLISCTTLKHKHSQARSDAGFSVRWGAKFYISRERLDGWDKISKNALPPSL